MLSKVWPSITPLIDDPKYELRNTYLKIIEYALVNTNYELRNLHKTGITAKISDQPTIYEVEIENRHGYFEINVVKIGGAIEEFIWSK